MRKQRDTALRELKKASARLDALDEAAQVLAEGGLRDLPSLLAEGVVSGHINVGCIFVRYLDDHLSNARLPRDVIYAPLQRYVRSNRDHRAVQPPLTHPLVRSSLVCDGEQTTCGAVVCFWPHAPERGCDFSQSPAHTKPTRDITDCPGPESRWCQYQLSRKRFDGATINFR